MKGWLALKILVVDDHALVREGLRQVLKGLGGQTHILEACTGQEALALADAHDDLDLVLLDFHLPDMGGLQALDALARNHPELPLLVLSGTVDPHLVHEVLARGAAGYLPKSGLSEELLQTIRRVLNGEIHVPTPWPAPKRPAPHLPAPPTLTPRQQEVLTLLLAGYSNKAMGRLLGLSDETVKNHVSAILRAFGVATRTQAVMAASRLGFEAEPPTLAPKEDKSP